MKKLLPVILLILPVLGFAQRKEKVKEHTVSGNYNGAHEHDGFYLSMALGPAFSAINYRYTGPAGSPGSTGSIRTASAVFNGNGAEFDLKIGGAVMENLIIHGTIISTAVVGPDVRSNGRHAKTRNDFGISETMIGGGATYYLMPLNMFGSASAGIGHYTVSQGNSSINTDRGFAMQLKIGKEWWISKNWGFGIGLTYGKTTLTNRNGSHTEEFDSNHFAVLFNTTFN